MLWLTESTRAKHTQHRAKDKQQTVKHSQHRLLPSASQMNGFSTQIATLLPLYNLIMQQGFIFQIVPTKLRLHYILLLIIKC